MTDNEIRVAIAEACGFTNIRQIKTGPGEPPKFVGTDSDGFGCISVPSYLTSLDAMAEAEKVLTDEQRLKYAEQLLNPAILPRPKAPSAMSDSDVDLLLLVTVATATARQRALAFLATIQPTPTP